MKHTKRIESSQLKCLGFKHNLSGFEIDVSLFQDREYKKLRIELYSGLVMLRQGRLEEQRINDSLVVVFDESVQGTLTTKVIKRAYKLLTSKKLCTGQKKQN